jgi:hypothetical protein
MKFDATKLLQLKRPQYFSGQLLTAADLQAEQNYHREKAWLHNRMLHGYGIVSGLEVMIQENDNGDAHVVISPGYALDGYGRELIVTDTLTLVLSQDRHDFLVYLKYAEHDDAESKTSMSPQATRVVETVQVLFEPPSDRLVSPTAREDFAIPIARMRKPHRQWQRDRDFRPPRARS